MRFRCSCERDRSSPSAPGAEYEREAEWSAGVAGLSGPNCRGSIYTDDGNSFGYKRGDYYRGQLSCESSGNSVKVAIAAGEGKYIPWWKSYYVVVVDFPKAPSSVAVNGRAIRDFHYDAKGKSVTFQVPFSRQASEAVVQY